MKKEDLLKGEDYVECETCGHIISKKRAQIVNINGGAASYLGWTHIRCELHKFPYDEGYKLGASSVYYKKMEVSEDGTPVGYKKISEKK